MMNPTYWWRKFLPELRRTPCMRTSQNAQKAKFGEFFTCEVPRIPIPRSCVNEPPARMGTRGRRRGADVIEKTGAPRISF
jgi:hypothetical protein